MTSRANLFGLTPAQHRARANAADKRIRTYQPPTPPTMWEPPAGLKPTLPGHVHGITGTNPWEVQCDGCGATETPRLIILSTTRFHPHNEDTRRLCPDCQHRAGWAG